MLSQYGTERLQRHQETTMGAPADDTVPLADYTRALDEIYALRALLAYEAVVLKVHLEYKTFPKTRREVAAGQVDVMSRAARGEAGAAYQAVGMTDTKRALRSVGAPDTLTREQWEAEKSNL